MSARVVSSVSTAEVRLIKPRASVVVRDLEAGAEFAVPVAAVAYVDLAVTAELDTTGRFKFIGDASAVVDLAKLASDKKLTDSAETGSLTRYALVKRLQDTTSTLDAVAFGVAKQLADAYQVPDQVALDLAKRVFDATGLNDGSFRLLAKLLRDGVAMNDSFDTSDGSVYSFTKNITNAAFTSEAMARSVVKKLEDSAAMLSLAALHVEKAPFTDGAETADSKALASSLGKFEALTASDAQALDVTKLVVDLFVVADQITQLLAKALADEATTGDASFYAADKALFEESTAADASAYDLSKLLGDSVGTTDTVVTTLVFIRDKQDLFEVTDSRQVLVSKALSSEAASSDQATSSVNKLLLDGVGITDQTGVGDGFAFVVVRSVGNVMFVTDSAAKGTATVRVDTAVSTDVGTLVNQGYCDLTYFAEDYVGDTRSF